MALFILLLSVLIICWFEVSSPVFISDCQWMIMQEDFQKYLLFVSKDYIYNISSYFPMTTLTIIKKHALKLKVPFFKQKVCYCCISLLLTLASVWFLVYQANSSSALKNG
jgi:hypothetical protein